MPTGPTLETQYEDTSLFQFAALLDVAGFRHVVTAKPWNMATHCGPDASHAAERRRRVCEWLGVPFERLVAPDQVHSPHVVQVTSIDAGKGRDGRESALKFVDGLVCGEANLPIIQFSADCPLVLLVDPAKRVVGTAHASWRGTVAGITTELVRQLREAFKVEPSELVGAICPCAGRDEYEVGEEVRRVALARLGADADRFFPKVAGRLRFDMRGANVDQLVLSGVREERIFVASESTLTDSRFYSHRREAGNAGRFALIAGFVD